MESNAPIPSIFLPRGIRNKNPGNIRLGKVRWKGQKEVQADPDFVEFETEDWGLRALARLLLTYHLKYGLETVQSLINRYAPPSENATDHYIRTVARAMKTGRTDPVDLRRADRLEALARAIVRHENGPPPAGYPDHWYSAQAYSAAVAAVVHPTI